MNKYLLIISYFISILTTQAQDTIFKIMDGMLLVRVLEISSANVTYKFYFNPDGVIHTIPLNQIEKIVYQNGVVEKRIMAINPNINTNLPAQKIFIIEDNHISYNNNDITHKVAFNMMLKRNPQLNIDELNDVLLNAEGKKSGQLIFTITGPVFLIGCFSLGRRNYYGPADKQKFQTFMLSGLSLFAASEITALIYKSLKNKQIRKAAMLYNKEIIN